MFKMTTGALPALILPMITSFSDCGLPVNQPPFLSFNFDVAARLVLLYEVGQGRLKTGFEGRRCDLYGALCSWRAGVQDVIRSHPNLVLAGRRSAARNLFGHGKALTPAWRRLLVTR